MRVIRIVIVCAIASGADGYSVGLNKPKFNYPYDVTLNRQHHEGFGFVLVSSSTKSGATIGLSSMPAVSCCCHMLQILFIKGWTNQSINQRNLYSASYTVLNGSA